MTGRRNDFPITENFRGVELECHGENCCGGAVIVRDALAKALQALRYVLGKPFSPTCGYRCPKHNAEVGGSATSDHLTGHAVDIPVPEGWEAEAFARQCLKAGFLRAGYYNKRGFVHATIARREGLPRIWIGEK